MENKYYQIQAKRTTYKNILFRSKLEAQWALFFDLVGVTWEYEAKHFDLGQVRYLPDFWLPKLEVFVEIKPIIENSPFIWREKCRLLNKVSKRPVFLFLGRPKEKEHKVYAFGLNTIKSNEKGMFEKTCIKFKYCGVTFFKGKINLENIFKEVRCYQF